MLELGLQLYTVRHAFGGDLCQILQAVAEIGYKIVELAGYGNTTVGRLREVLGELGIKAVSTHVSMETIRRDFPRVVAEAKELGCDYVTISSPPDHVKNQEGDWRFFREELRFYAGQFHAYGLILSYHNHAQEFSPLETGRTPIEILFEKEEPYTLQLDVYWASYADYSPQQILKTTPALCHTIHVKDMSEAHSKEDTIVGAGVLDWDAIFSAATQKGVRYLFVEVDNPKDDPVATAAYGYHFCREKLRDLLNL